MAKHDTAADDRHHWNSPTEFLRFPAVRLDRVNRDRNRESKGREEGAPRDEVRADLKPAAYSLRPSRNLKPRATVHVLSGCSLVSVYLDHNLGYATPIVTLFLCKIASAIRLILVSFFFSRYRFSFKTISAARLSPPVSPRLSLTAPWFSIQ